MGTKGEKVEYLAQPACGQKENLAIDAGWATFVSSTQPDTAMEESVTRQLVFLQINT
jgi:hypothetical protein